MVNGNIETEAPEKPVEAIRKKGNATKVKGGGRAMKVKLPIRKRGRGRRR